MTVVVNVVGTAVLLIAVTVAWRRHASRIRLHRIGGGGGLNRPAVAVPRLLVELTQRRPVLVGGLAVGSVGLTALFTLGVIAGVLTSAYCAVAVATAHRLRRERRATRARAASIEELALLAADVRAGSALPGVQPGSPEYGVGYDPAAARRIDAARRLSSTSGAPLAELLDRVDHDLRCAEAVRRSVAAQTAGTRASAWLLAGLPLAGVGLGEVLGLDPSQVLLHTPIGGACVLVAALLQGLGLLWVARLCHVPEGRLT